MRLYAFICGNGYFYGAGYDNFNEAAGNCLRK